MIKVVTKVSTSVQDITETKITSKKAIRVLHVDDDAFFLKMTKGALEEQNSFHFDFAQSVEEAMKKLKQDKFEVIVSDFQMVDKDGLDFLRELKASGNMVPFILFTGKGREEVAIKALNLGAFRYIDKSGDSKTVYGELASCIQQAFDHGHLEESLRESEEKFRAIFENCSEAIVITDDSWKLCYVNQAALKIFGCTKENLGASFFEQCMQNFLSSFHKKVDDVMDKLRVERTEPFTTETLEVPFLRADGKKRHVEVSMSPFRQDERWNVVSFIRDVTERKEHEIMLLESRQKFMALFSENPEAVAFCDEDFLMVDVNPRFSSLFGYCSDEVAGRDIINLIVPEKLKEEAKLIRKQLLGGHLECSTVRERKDGSRVNVALSGAPVVVNDEVIGYVVVYKNITDIVFANDELSRMFEELNSMLNKTSMLNEKLSVTGSLTRHDVRNKLAAITGYTYIAKKRSADNVEVKEYLTRIEEVVKNVVRILDFAKTYEMLGNQERAPVNVGDMVNDAASLFADLKGVTILNECKAFEVLADSLLMELFHNLIDNSLKYGEKITQIKVYTQQRGDCIELIYEDNGIGIDPEMRSGLFQKGFGKGTGYGLYLMKRICEIYGWTITENGEPGKGARFTIKMPSTA
jgi:PAS domain S-box-containing protein